MKLVFGKVDLIIFDDDAFGFEKLALDVGAAKGEMWSEMAGGIDDFVTWETVAIGIAVEGVADGSGGIGTSEEGGDLLISNDLATRNR